GGTTAPGAGCCATTVLGGASLGTRRTSDTSPSPFNAALTWSSGRPVSSGRTTPAGVGETARVGSAVGVGGAVGSGVAVGWSGAGRRAAGRARGRRRWGRERRPRRRRRDDPSSGLSRKRLRFVQGALEFGGRREAGGGIGREAALDDGAQRGRDGRPAPG